MVRHIVLAAVPEVVLHTLDSAVVVVVLHKTAVVHSLLVEEGKDCVKEDIDLAGVGNFHREADVLAGEDTALPEVDNNPAAEVAVRTDLGVDTDPAAAGIAVGVVGHIGPDSLAAGRTGKTFATRYLMRRTGRLEPE